MSDTTRMTGASPPARRTVRITWSTALLVVSVVLGFVVLRAAFVAAHRILGWTAASVAVAVFVEPIISFVDRFLPRVLSVIVTFLAIAAVVFGVVLGVVNDLDREVARLQDEAPGAVADLEARDDELGRFAADIELSERTETFLDELDERFGGGEGTLAENATAVPVFLVGVVLTIFLLVYGSGIASGAARQLDDRRRLVVSVVLRNAAQRARRTVAVLVVQGAVVGLLAAGAAATLDLPAPVVLGLVAGVGAMVPDLGILLGSLPTVAAAAAFDTPTSAVLILLSAFVLQLVEVFHVRVRANDYGTPVGPAVVSIVAVVGYAIYGPGMAVYAVVYAIFALAVIDQVPTARAALDGTVI
jgi:putative heme transporter